jgi:hypothetical protein
MRRTAIVGALIFIATVAAADSPDSDEYGGAWQVNGQQDGCSITTATSDGTSFAISAIPHGYAVILKNRGWEVPNGDAFPIVTYIDGRHWDYGVAIAEDDMVQFAYDQDFIQAFTKGRHLRIDFENGRRFIVDLRGSAAAAKQLSACSGTNDPG